MRWRLAVLGALWAAAAPAASLDYARHLAQQGDCYRALSEVFAWEYGQGENAATLEIKLPCLAERKRWERFDPALDRALEAWPSPLAEQWAFKGLELAWDRGDEARAEQLYRIHLAELAEPFPKNPSEPKSRTTAMALQAVLPGAGLAYAGKWGPAAASLGLNGLFLYGTVRAWDQGQNALAALLFFFEWSWYFGGIEAAQEAVDQHNQQALARERRVWLELYQTRF